MKKILQRFMLFLFLVTATIGTAFGQVTITLNVVSGGTAVQGAFVAVKDNSAHFLGSGTTDVSGNVVVSITQGINCNITIYYTWLYYFYRKFHFGC